MLDTVTMTKLPHLDLSRRERQIIDILYAQGRATAAQVQAALPDPPQVQCNSRQVPRCPPIWQRAVTNWHTRHV